MFSLIMWCSSDRSVVSERVCPELQRVGRCRPSSGLTLLVPSLARAEILTLYAEVAGVDELTARRPPQDRRRSPVRKLLKETYSTHSVRALLARHAAAVGQAHNMAPPGHGTSCSPGSKPKASMTPSSSPTAATPAGNLWRSTASPLTDAQHLQRRHPPLPRLKISQFAAHDTFRRVGSTTGT